MTAPALKGESRLQMAERHVRDAEAHVARQRRIVLDLSGHGHPIDLALELLDEFERSLRDHRASLERIRAE
jgi:hypothetical protein